MTQEKPPTGSAETLKFAGKMFAILDKTFRINGKDVVIEVGRRAPGTRLIIDLGEDLLLTKEWRSELNAYDYRLPGGKVFDSLADYQGALSKGGDLAPAVLGAARNEAKEEAGVDTGDFAQFHKSIAGLTVDWDLYYFAVTNPTLSTQKLGEHEIIETVRISKEDAKRMCLDGSIGEERSALVLLRYLSQNP